LAIHKRCDVLLQALAIRQQAGARHEVVIAGDGPEEANLRALASALGLCDCTFVGPVASTEAAALMRNSKTLVVPSGYEPFGIVVLEGLASGCRVITSDAGGLKEAGGGFARIFRYNDAADLARVLEKDHCHALPLSAPPASLVHWLEGLSPTAVANRLLDVLLKID
jgi:glycosyltransferase involved in cell wall biosynthesis